MNQQQHPTPSKRLRRGTILGVSAGLVGGGLIGLAATVPSLTSAASDDSVDTWTDPAAEVISDSTVADRPDPGTRIRESLQSLVDDGTITADQADAVAAHLVDQAPDHGRRGPGGRGHRPGMDGEVVAGVIGIDAETLREAVQSGQSLAEVAEANGVDPQAVIDALVAEAQSHLDQAVQDGRLTEDEAATKAAEMVERITARVNGELPPRR